MYTGKKSEKILSFFPKIWEIFLKMTIFYSNSLIISQYDFEKILPFFWEMTKFFSDILNILGVKWSTNEILKNSHRNPLIPLTKLVDGSKWPNSKVL